VNWAHRIDPLTYTKELSLLVLRECTDDNSTQAEFDTETQNAINATLGVWTAGRP
jgi:hypothetical protein